MASEITRPTGGSPPLPKGFKRRLARQLLMELAPLLLFFLTFMWSDIIWATGVYAVATAVAVGAMLFTHRKLPVLPLISALLVMIFAGLTIVLEEEMFIKIKPTVVNGFYGVVLAGSWLLGYRLIKRVLGAECTLDGDGLRKLTVNVSAYLIGLALLNEIVWRTVPTDTWVVFKVFVMIAMNLVFGFTQLPLVKKHLVATQPG